MRLICQRCSAGFKGFLHATVPMPANMAGWHREPIAAFGSRTCATALKCSARRARLNRYWLAFTILKPPALLMPSRSPSIGQGRDVVLEGWKAQILRRSDRDNGQVSQLR